MLTVYEVVEMLPGTAGQAVRQTALRSDDAAFWLRYYQARYPTHVFRLSTFEVAED